MGNKLVIARKMTHILYRARLGWISLVPFWLLVSLVAADIGVKFEILTKPPIIQGEAVSLRSGVAWSESRPIDGSVEWVLPAFLSYQAHQTQPGSKAPVSVTQQAEKIIIKFTGVSLGSLLDVVVNVTVDPTKSLLGSKFYYPSSDVTLKYKPRDSCLGRRAKQASVYFAFFAPGCSGFEAFGLAGGRIKDSQILVTSLLPNTSAHASRLQSPSGWTPITSLDHVGFTKMIAVNFVQVDLKAIKVVFMAILSGIPKYNPIPSDVIKLSFSLNEYDWKIKENLQKIQILSGDTTDLVTVAMTMVATEWARYVRVNLPAYRSVEGDTYRYNIEIYTCDNTKSRGGEPSPIGLTSSATFPDSRFTSPSSLDSMHGPEHARLDHQAAGGGWCASTCDPSAYLEIDLGQTWNIMEVETQGRHSTDGVFRGVRTYSLSSSLDRTAWEQYKHDGATKTFLGNYIENLSTKNKLLNPLMARYIRFEPRTCMLQPCMRIELYGHIRQRDEIPNVFLRSMLLKKDTNHIYVCVAEVPKNKAHCHFSKDQGTSWTAVFKKVLNILAFDPQMKRLYALSVNRKYMRSKDEDGLKWRGYNAKFWRQIRDDPSFTTAVEIPFVPLTKKSYPVLEPLVTLVSDQGNQWIADQLGVYYKPSGGTPSMVMAFAPSTTELSPDICHRGPCLHGRCENLGNGHYRCHCRPGFTGDSCERAIDHCGAAGGNPCLNGGVCNNKIYKYACACAPHYSGNTCQEFDECSSSPCKNNGTCTDGANSFTCSCLAGFNLPTCDFDYCASTPCKNGGTCTNGASGYTCACATGYSGTTCGTSVCDSQPCANGGNCTATGATSYTCACGPHWIGQQCQTSVCNSNPCQNGGTCRHGNGGYYCNCVAYHGGYNCQFPPFLARRSSQILSTSWTYESTKYEKIAFSASQDMWLFGICGGSHPSNTVNQQITTRLREPDTTNVLASTPDALYEVTYGYFVCPPFQPPYRLTGGTTYIAEMLVSGGDLATRHYTNGAASKTVGWGDSSTSRSVTITWSTVSATERSNSGKTTQAEGAIPALLVQFIL